MTKQFWDPPLRPVGPRTKWIRELGVTKDVLDNDMKDNAQFLVLTVKFEFELKFDCKQTAVLL